MANLYTLSHQNQKWYLQDGYFFIRVTSGWLVNLTNSENWCKILGHSKDVPHILLKCRKTNGSHELWKLRGNVHSGIKSMRSYWTVFVHVYCSSSLVCIGDCWLGLTSNTVAFSKLYLTFLEDCLRLATPELLYTVDEVLSDVFKAQMLHVEASLSSDKYVVEVWYILLVWMW